MTTTAAAEPWVPTLTFKARLALVRNHMDWNTKEAALACGLPPQSWRNWEKGFKPRDYASACALIADRTGVDRDWLAFGMTEDQGSNKRRYEVPAPRTANQFCRSTDLIAA